MHGKCTICKKTAPVYDIKVFYEKGINTHKCVCSSCIETIERTATVDILPLRELNVPNGDFIEVKGFGGSVYQLAIGIDDEVQKICRSVIIEVFQNDECVDIWNYQINFWNGDHEFILPGMKSRRGASFKDIIDRACRKFNENRTEIYNYIREKEKVGEW